jgi:hypothetical protein
MKKVVVNIGLKIGTEEPQQQLSRTLSSLLKDVVLTNVRVEEEGVYKGNSERTLVAYFEVDSLGLLLNTLAWQLNQEAIAYKVDGVGGVAFNPWYKGEQFPFDQQFFID